MIAVSEAARNIVCSGGEPVGVTNCLNFGNPYNPEVYYQFVHAIKGMGEACLKFNTPVTGGNVSFYNQSEDGPVYPTPTIGMVGVLDSLDQKMTMHFKNAGDLIYMIGTHRDDINCSDYLHSICGITHSPAPHFDLEEESKIQSSIKRLIEAKIILSAHDISEGGLFTTVLESAIRNNLGFTIESDSSIRKDAFLFGEAQSRVIVSVSSELQQIFEAETQSIAFSKLGKVSNDGSIHIDGEDWGAISEWKNAYDTAIEKML